MIHYICTVSDLSFVVTHDFQLTTRGQCNHKKYYLFVSFMIIFKNENKKFKQKPEIEAFI